MIRKIAYALVGFFVILGAFNIGILLVASPLFILISRYGLKSKKMFWSSICLVIVCLLINMTIEKNPLLFPVVRGGTVKILEDGYLATYSDGSGGFSKENFADNQGRDPSCVGPYCGIIKFYPLKKGEIYNVTGVIVTLGAGGDFRPRISLVTSIGRFAQDDYQSLSGGSEVVHIKLSKPVHSLLFDKLSYLMFWPISMLGV